ncbi:hypothetical protein [Paraburkholderia aromaticivorans]|uniref:hypothetical protein n=1 Tax=Paraburkholderia aromaticivorans TaxID=2026199 RepID=UPI001455E264|nr:hypothetical protein [Paraburkholderia aromaticivorans]
MYVNVRKPNIQVLLHKVVTRTSATGNVSATTGSGAPTAVSSSSTSSSGLAGAPSQTDSPSNIYDLTSWLGEGSVVRVQKSVRDSSGAFSIDFVDQIMGGLNDTLYTLIEPMDMFEIRFAGDAYKYAGTGGQQLPIMMRGFVADIERSQGMGADGKPRRTIHVTGHDYHKILQIIQIFNMPCTPDVANLVSSFPLFSKYGEDLNVQTTTQFVLQVFNEIVNKYISGMQQAGATSGAALAEVATDIQVPDALMSVQLGTFNSGTVQQLLEEYLDIGPFNEFFVEDRDAGAWGPAGPYAVYRPTPFLGAVSRSPLQPIQTSVTTGVSTDSQLSPTANCVSITTDPIISISARRSDANVANYFWVDAPRFNMNYGDLTKMYATYALQQGAVPYYITNYQNVNPALYGLRKMEVATQQGSLAEKNSGNGTPAGDGRFANQASFLSWIDDRRNLLIALNRDNVIFENGEMHLEGNERIKAGTYVKVRYGATPNNPAGNIQSLYYAHSVTHVFEPFGNYMTSIEYDRGTNFADCTTQAQGSVPTYYSEQISWSNS